MASVSKRKSDAARERGRGKWTMYWIGEDGKRKSKVGTTDKAESMKIALRLESEAKSIREGTLDPSDRSRRLASLRSVADHVADYAKDLKAKGDTEKHVKRIKSVLLRLFDDASVDNIGDLAPDRIRASIGRMRVIPKKEGKATRPISARTKNLHLTTVKSFANWLYDNNRLKEHPRGLMKLTPYSEKEDRRHVRRALTKDELARLFEAAKQGTPVEGNRGPRKEGRVLANVRWLTGPERAALYRLAMGTGFRANELRTLTPECFRLDGPEPDITLDPKNEKNSAGTCQPITRELADQFRPFLEGKEPGKPVLNIPIKTAQLLRIDLAKAGIPYRDGEGKVADFHALRGSYITHLIMDGVNPKIVQALARHSTITLTLDRYTSLDADDKRAGLERRKTPKDGDS